MPSGPGMCLLLQATANRSGGVINDLPQWITHREDSQSEQTALHQTLLQAGELEFELA